MMKKLGMIVFVMALVVAFALPAFAYTVEGAKGERFTIGGALYFDIGYRNTDKDYNTMSAPGFGGKDNTRLFMANTYNTNLNGTFTVNDVSFTWVLYMNSDVQSARDYTGANLGSTTATTGAYANYRDYLQADVWYGTYKFGNMMLQGGKMAGAINTIGLSQTLGYNPSGGSHIAGIAKGWAYDNKHPQLRFTHNINKMFGYHIALVSPGTPAELVGTTYVNSYAMIPTIAAKVMLNFGMVQVWPAFGWQQLQYEAATLPVGYETSVTGWVVKLPVQVNVGGFTGKLDVTYGQNLGTGHGTSAWFTEVAFGSYQRNAAGKVLNANTLAGFIELAYNFGKVTPRIYYGQTTNSNSDYYVLGDDSNTRTIMGINASYYVTPNFIIKPEFFMANYGTTPGVASKPNRGSEWLGGLEFIFAF